VVYAGLKTRDIIVALMRHQSLSNIDILPFRRRVLFLFLLIAFAASYSAGKKSDSHRMEQILNLVAKDVQNNFYDPTLKGLDWAALTEQARQRIRDASETGEMIGAISALLYQLHDSHTVFIPPGLKIKANYGFRAKPFGDTILVYQVDKDGPAAKAGLQLGDQIVGVNNLNAARASFFGMMRYLTVLDPREELDVEVSDRGSSHVAKIAPIIETQSRESFYLLDRGRQQADAEGPSYALRDYKDGCVYFQLRSFLVRTTELAPAVKRLKTAKSIILDLRGNGGGSIDTLIDLVGQFVPEAFVMATSVSRRKPEPIRVEPMSPHLVSPLIILLDSASASASEMFARTMQIHKRAIVVGDRSSGSVDRALLFLQPVGPIQYAEFATEIAVSKVVMEDGEELEHRGVTPDEICVPTPADLREEKDPCLERALAMIGK